MSKHTETPTADTSAPLTDAEGEAFMEAIRDEMTADDADDAEDSDQDALFGDGEDDDC